jgi:hypothetical protein
MKPSPLAAAAEYFFTPGKLAGTTANVTAGWLALSTFSTFPCVTAAAAGWYSNHTFAKERT